jgi:hypothetical protein
MVCPQRFDSGKVLPVEAVVVNSALAIPSPIYLSRVRQAIRA